MAPLKTEPHLWRDLCCCGNHGGQHITDCLPRRAGEEYVVPFVKPGCCVGAQIGNQNVQGLRFKVHGQKCITLRFSPTREEHASMMSTWQECREAVKPCSGTIASATIRTVFCESVAL